MASRRKPLRKFRRLLDLERLEDRTLLTVTPIGVPEWISEGPGPIVNGANVQGPGIPPNTFDTQQVGAVESIGLVPQAGSIFAPRPDVLFIGTTNGGIWESEKANTSLPDWKALTDQVPAMSIGGLAVSPIDNAGNLVSATTDPNRLVIYAGTGNFSSFRQGGAAIGVLKSTDGGQHWALKGTATFPQSTQADFGIRTVVATRIATGTGNGSDQLVFAATALVDGTGTQGGLYFSLDSGETWKRLSGTFGIPPNEGCTEVVADPGDPNGITFFAAFPNTGVLRFTVNVPAGGVTPGNPITFPTVNITTNLLTGPSPLIPAGTLVTRIRLAASPVPLTGGGIDRPLYASVYSFNSNGTVGLFGVFQFNPGTNTWKALGRPAAPNTQGDLHGSIAADPANANLVYIGGSTEASAGAFNASIYVGDASRAPAANPPAPPANLWSRILGAPLTNAAGAVIGGANNTSPHADSRNLAFDSSGNLLDADDGGIYRLINTNSPTTRQWTSFNVGLSNTEFVSVAFDHLTQDIIGGAQDNGSSEQRTQGNNSLPQGDWTLAFNVPQPPPNPPPLPSTAAFGGDGYSQAVDNSSSHPTESVRYSEQNNFLGLSRRIFQLQNTPSGLVETETFQSPLFLAAFAGAAPFSGLVPADQNGQLVVPIPFALNNIFPERMMMLGLNGLYESLLPSPRGAPPPAPRTLGDVIIPRTQAGMGRVLAIAYGGRDPSLATPTDAADVAYVGAGRNLFLRAHGANRFTQVTLYPGGPVRAIVMDPDNWHTVYVIDDRSVFRGTNVGVAGENWTRITGNLANLLQATQIGDHRTPDLRSLEFVRIGPQNMLLVGGFGGVYRLIGAESAVTNNTGWSLFGSKLPNVLVTSIHFDRQDDLLIAGTLGRGAWEIPQVSASLVLPSALQIDFDSPQQTIVLNRDLDNPLMLDVFDNITGITKQFQLADFRLIQVNGQGGTDSLVINTSAGAIQVSDGVLFLGGGGQSELQIDGNVGSDSFVAVPKDPVSDPQAQHSGLGGFFTSGPAATISYDNVGKVTNNIPPQPANTPGLLLSLGAAIGNLSGLNSNFADRTLLDQTLPVFGNSLGDALEGALLPPAGGSTDADLAPAPSAESSNNPNTSIIRRLIETGTGAFSLSDIGTSITTLDGLASRFDGLDNIPGNVTFTVQNGVVRFDITIDKTLTGEIPLEAQAQDGQIDIEGSASISAEVILHLVFGVDAFGFFIDTAGQSPNLIVKNIQITGDVEGEGRFGFTEVDLRDATLQMDPNFEETITLQDPGPDPFTGVVDQRLRLNQMGSDPTEWAIGALVNAGSGDDFIFTPSMTPAAMTEDDPAPFSLGNDPAIVRLTWGDAEDPTTATDAAENASGQLLTEFLNAKTDQISSGLTALGPSLQGLAQLNGSAFGIPLAVTNSSIGTILDSPIPDLAIDNNSIAEIGPTFLEDSFSKFVVTLDQGNLTGSVWGKSKPTVN